MKVQEIMIPHVVRIDHDASVIQAAKMMRDQRVGSLVVVVRGAPQGMLTDKDIAINCVAQSHDPEVCRVSDHMSRPLHSISSTADVFDAVKLMVLREVRRVPVVDEGILVGMISLSDVALTLARPLSDLMLALGAERKSR